MSLLPTTDSETLSAAGSLLELDAKWLQPFEAEDPFHPGMVVRGAISRRPDHRYGALAFTHVGGRPAPQRLYATPKLHYPFDRAGRFHFPPLRRVHLYEKLDGTNVLAYRYHDADGRAYLSYKLRLAPFLRNSRFGPFLDFWRELLLRHPGIPQLVERNRCHVSLEMFGRRNTHLILYEAELETAVLFGIRDDGQLVPAHHLETLGVPVVPLWGLLEAGEDPVARYGELRAEMEARMRKADDDKLVGNEGAVWCVTDEGGKVSLWKCKPESVEAIHWAGGLNKEAVMATCWNLLETEDSLTYETLEPLLLEEYTAEDIARFRVHIDACIAEVAAEFRFREEVLARYDALGTSIWEDKGVVMRQLAPHYRREKMKKVYAAIVQARPAPRGD